MMRLLIGVLLIVHFGINAQDVRAQEGWGLGVIVGEPTGLSFKNWTSGRTAFDAAAAWSFSGNDSFQLHADYLWHNFSWQRSTDIRGVLPIYYGVGVRVKMGSNGRRSSDERIGIRVPGGISYLLEEAPVELFLELVPLLDLIPDTDFGLNGAIGARFYF